MGEILDDDTGGHRLSMSLLTQILRAKKIRGISCKASEDRYQKGLFGSLAIRRSVRPEAFDLVGKRRELHSEQTLQRDTSEREVMSLQPFLFRTPCRLGRLHKPAARIYPHARFVSSQCTDNLEPSFLMS